MNQDKYIFSQINSENLTTFNKQNLFTPVGVLIFALMGFTAIPEMRRIKNSNKITKKAIILGAGIPMIIYAIFTLIFVGVLGTHITEVSTLSLGKLVIILGMLTMLTSYLILSYALRDSLVYDFKIKPLNAWLITTLTPLTLFVIVFGLQILSFIQILGISGVISGGLTGILILLMNYQSKKLGNRKPEYSIPINKTIIIIISLIFLVGVIVELFF